MAERDGCSSDVPVPGSRKLLFEVEISCLVINSEGNYHIFFFNFYVLLALIHSDNLS